MRTAGTILRLAGRGYLAALPEHHRDIATKQLNVILNAAEDYNARLAAIHDDDTLSPAGRSAEAAKVRAAALATLTAIETTTIKTLTERVSTLEAALLKRATPTAPKDPAERVAYEMRLQEIRAALGALSAAERLHVYRSTTDQFTVAAIETAPATVGLRADGSKRLEPFVDPDGMQAARLERAASADPVTATTLREVRTLREVYVLSVNSIKQEIGEEVGQPA